VLRQPAASKSICVGSRGAANNLDAADQGVSNGRSLKRIPSNPLFSCLGLSPCSPDEFMELREITDSSDMKLA